MVWKQILLFWMRFVENAISAFYGCMNGTYIPERGLCDDYERMPLWFVRVGFST